MPGFSDYIVFVDESGNHGLSSIDPEFPVFALAFCVVAKADYTNRIVPAFQNFKFRYWGHDAVVLHEREIRKEEGPFGFLRTDLGQRESFHADLATLMTDAPITIIASVIDKNRLRDRYVSPFNPYEIALHFCLEHLFDFLLRCGEEGKQVHVILECRGRQEDRELELEFRRISQENQQFGYQQRDFTRFGFEPIFARKSVNSTGLQLADLVARPIALNTVRPDQPNRAMGIIQGKKPTIKAFP